MKTFRTSSDNGKDAQIVKYLSKKLKDVII